MKKRFTEEQIIGILKQVQSDMKIVDECPEIVNQKVRIGDCEGDTVSGKNHRGGLVTLAERKSRYVLAGHIGSKHADVVTAVTKRLLTPYKDKCHTITFDNGKEFENHESIAA